jgi:ATP dependent DNA ligase domain
LVHEVKHDGYRLIVRREGPTVRLFTRRGYDWTDRYPAIAAAAAKLRARSFTMDGEAVVIGADGVAVFDALHRRHRASDALLHAFDLPELDGGEDLRPLPLGERKAKLARLLARVVAGIAFNEHTDEDGAAMFLHACNGPRRDRLEAADRALPIRPVSRLDQDQKPGQPHNAESARRALVTPTGVDCGRDSDNTAAMGVAKGWPRLSRGGQICTPSSDAS